MKLPDDPRERRAAIIAAAVTFGVAVVILVLLFIFTLGTGRQEMAYASIPEIQDEEEVFLDPELMILNEAGEPDATEDDAPAPAVPGIPALGPEEITGQSIENQQAAVEQSAPVPPIASVKDSDGAPVQQASPSEETKTPESQAGITLNWNNGSGKTITTNFGSGGDGIGKEGKLSGRRLIKCPSYQPKGQGTVTVTVKVLVNAAGKVVGNPEIVGTKGSVTNDDKNQCKKMARESEWSPKNGATDEYGTITFTITHT